MEKPSDLLLGLLDFFGVLLPGMAAVGLLYPHLPLEMRASLDAGTSENAKTLFWIVFLLGSYALGHFVFAVGSRLDPLYDLWRRRTKTEDAPFSAASKLRQALTKELGSGKGKGQYSTLKWARTYVGIHSAAARAEIDRYEATSKFFRGSVVVAIGAIAHFFLVAPHAGLAAAAFIVAALSFERFCDQRWKMTEAAYVAAVLIHKTASDKKAASSTTESD